MNTCLFFACSLVLLYLIQASDAPPAFAGRVKFIEQMRRWNLDSNWIFAESDILIPEPDSPIEESSEDIVFEPVPGKDQDEIIPKPPRKRGNPILKDTPQLSNLNCEYLIEKFGEMPHK